MTDQNQALLDDLVADFCRRAQLYGCDAVQVLLSVHDNIKQTTNVLKQGRGNWYTRKGLAQEFIDEDLARTENNVRIKEYGDE